MKQAGVVVIACIVGVGCSSSADKACHRLAGACGAELTKDDFQDCADAVNSASRHSKTDVAAKILACTTKQSSCAEALGCATGAGLAAFDAMKSDFAAGLERARSSGTTTTRRTSSTTTTTTTSSSSRGGAPPGDDRLAVRYLKVAARPGHDDFGDNLTVSIDVEILSATANVAPDIEVTASCGAQTETERAFFMGLANARPHDRRTDTIKLFHHHDLETPAKLCDLTLSLSEGATGPEHFCFHDGVTTPGGCR